MANIFLDTSAFVDILTKRRIVKPIDLDQNKVFISPLSVYIFLYLYKEKVPTSKLDELKQHVVFVPFDQSVVDKALTGPTDDFEDNVQLHCAAEGECDYFLTSDEKILKMKFFGKVELVSALP